MKYFKKIPLLLMLIITAASAAYPQSNGNSAATDTIFSGYSYYMFKEINREDAKVAIDLLLNEMIKNWGHPELVTSPTIFENLNDMRLNDIMIFKTIV